MTMERTDERRLHLEPTQLLTQDEVLGYIAWRKRQPLENSNAAISRDIGMVDTWISDITLGNIKDMKPGSKARVTVALKRKYGAEGIPVVDPTPVVVKAKDPSDALHEGFGRHSGDPQRPLAPVHEAAPPPPPGATYGVVITDDLTEGEELEAEIQALVDEKTPEELAGLYLQGQDSLASMRQRLETLQKEYSDQSIRATELGATVTRMGAQVSAMDNHHERLKGEIAERNRTIQGQAEDLAEYEKAMDMQGLHIAELEAWRKGTIDALRPLAILLAQLVPPPTYFVNGKEVDAEGLKEYLRENLGPGRQRVGEAWGQVTLGEQPSFQAEPE